MKNIFKFLSLFFCIVLLIAITGCKKKYTVTFMDYDGTVLKEDIVKKGESATAPITPSRDGYIFTSWSGEYTNVLKDSICIAQYRPDELKYELSKDKKFYLVTGLKSRFNKKNVIIPASYNNLPVIGISDCAFSDCISLESIEIPNSVTSIGKMAFVGCTSLESIEIPNSVTSIGESAFFGCTSLESIEIPNSVTSIGDSAFRACRSLVSITIPFVGATLDGTINTHFNYIFGQVPSSLKEVTVTGGMSIGDSAFSGFTSLESIKIPNSVTSIGESAFKGCRNLVSIKIPNSVTSIGDSAFKGCTILESIEIPNSVTSIGESAFSRCTSLESIEIPNSVTSIGGRAFYGCTSLESIVIPNSVTSIGESAFYKCTSLESIEIPNSVTSIGGWAFYGCTSLESIEIPNSVTSIGGGAFSGCTSLTIYCEVTSKPDGWITYWNDSNCPVIWGYEKEQE